MADLAYQHLAAAHRGGIRGDAVRTVRRPCRGSGSVYDARERILRDQASPELAAPLDDTGQTTITIG